jgi:hypothetical protein
MGYANINNPANYQLAMMGQFGFRKIDDSFTPVSGEFYRIIEVISTSATVTATSVNGDSLTSEALVQGTKLYGLFSAVSVSGESDVVIAYIA